MHCLGLGLFLTSDYSAGCGANWEVGHTQFVVCDFPASICPFSTGKVRLVGLGFNRIDLL